MVRVLFHSVVTVLLLVLTQIGAAAWLASLPFRRKLPAFLVMYVALTVASIWIAPLFGRVALTCFGDGPLKVHSWMYCALNRNYVAPELRDVLVQTAQELNDRFPETATIVLDANFPFFDGFPLLPHLSHDDGDKVDIAFYYLDDAEYARGATRSPIGYFAFEDGPSECGHNWLTLRWNLGLLQPLWRDYTLDAARTRAILQILAGDDMIGKIFIEPHLVLRLDAAHSNIRFQGCRAARHDDHIHLQLK